MPAELVKCERVKGRPMRWLVVLEGREIGVLERWANGAGFPWFAYVGIGRESQSVGTFHPETVIYANAPPVFGNGGKDAAIAAIVAAHQERQYDHATA